MMDRFFIIDDSELDCYIAHKKIEHVTQNIQIVSFNEATAALKVITNEDLQGNITTIILLDILMPVMNGYDFMDSFENLDEKIKSKYIVIAITSSMYKNQIDKIFAYKSIKGILEKPFTIEELNKIITKIDSRFALLLS